MDAFAPPRLPGLLARRPLGQGANPPWLAKADDGSWVVARPGVRPPDLPDHPVLLTVYGSVADTEGESWVITEYTSGSGLDRRLDRVGAVGRAAALEWGCLLAGALAALHAAGLAHGDLRPSRVLLGPRDTVVLDASCAAPVTGGEKAADVTSLAELIEQVVGGPLDGPSGDILLAAAAGDLDAEGLARELGGGVRGRRDRRAPARRASRGLLAGAAVVVVLAAAAGLGVRLAATPIQPAVLAVVDDAPTDTLSGGPTLDVASSSGAIDEASTDVARTDVAPTTATPLQPPRAEDPDWQAVLTGLDLVRGLAFESADPSVLDRVDASGSEAGRRDHALVRALRLRHVTAHGWLTQLIAVVPRSVATNRATLVVTDTRSAYLLRDQAGAVVAREPERGPQTWLVRLARTDDGWRIGSVDELPVE